MDSLITETILEIDFIQDYTVTVNKIYFTPEVAEVVSLCSTSTPSVMNNTSEIIPMSKNESRNIILKFANSPHSKPKTESEEMKINVQWEIRKTDGIVALGNSQIDVQESVKSVESSFVFQVEHINTVYADFRVSSLCSCNITLIIHSRISGNFSIQLESNPPKEE